MAAVVGIGPAHRKRFTGGKGQVRFCKGFRVLRLFPVMEAAANLLNMGIKQCLGIQYFNQVPGCFFSDKPGGLLGIGCTPLT